MTESQPNQHANPIRRLWLGGGCPVGAWCLSPDPMLAEATARAGFPWICIDMQHGWFDLGALPALVQAVAIGGSAPIVRVPANEPWLIGRALDIGAFGVMIPLVDTADAARRAVAACRYAPTGGRSWGAIRTAQLVASTARVADREIICLVQVESRLALDNLDEICATPGLDGVYIGPGDLALSLGVRTGKDHAEETLTGIADVAHRHGIAAGMHGESGEEARWAIEHGFDITTAGADVDFLYVAARAALAGATGTEPAATPEADAALAHVPRIAV